MECMHPITNKFPGGVFMHVRKLCMNDLMRSIEYDFFVLICQAFPLLEFLGVVSSVEQKKRPNKLDEHEQTSSAIEYSHLMTLHLIMAHVDYTKQFLLDSNIRLPRLNELFVDYANFANVTENFTSDVVHAKCEKLKTIIFSRPPSTIEKNVFRYFPSVVISIWC